MFGGLAGALRSLISRKLSEKAGFCTERPESRPLRSAASWAGRPRPLSFRGGGARERRDNEGLSRRIWTAASAAGFSVLAPSNGAVYLTLTWSAARSSSRSLPDTVSVLGILPALRSAVINGRESAISAATASEPPADKRRSRFQRRPFQTGGLIGLVTSSAAKVAAVRYSAAVAHKK